MNIDLDRAVKSLRKLRRAMKDAPRDPSPENIHRLRTQARRIEAIVHFLSPHDSQAQRLARLAKPVRRAAGKVRDMDVLLAALFSLSAQPVAQKPASSAPASNESATGALVRLGEHLATQREQHLKRLCRAVDKRTKLVRRHTKRYARRLRKQSVSASGFSPAAAQVLAAQLEHWPKLHAANLHEFRIQAKQLRYMLQLTPDADPAHLEALTATKDATGAWHDWLELGNIAAEILHPNTDRYLLDRIHAITRDKLRTALTTANRLRAVMFPARRAA